MTWVFICIAIGAASFLIWVIVDFYHAASRLKPQADLIGQEIRECEVQIELERSALEATKQEVDLLHREIGALDRDVSNTGKVLEKYRQRERRLKPTKFKVDNT